MPTPRDSTEDLPPQLEPHVHTSCPPDPADRPSQWSRQLLGDIEHVIADVATATDSARRDDPAAEADTHVLDDCGDRPVNKGLTNKSPSRSTAELSPPPAADSARIVIDEEKQVTTTSATATMSSAVNLPLSERYGIASSRVRVLSAIRPFLLLTWISSYKHTRLANSGMVAGTTARKPQSSNGTMLRSS